MEPVVTSPDLAPYAQAAPDLYRNGWSPLPLPRGQKWPPPNGFTGADGKRPDREQIEAWIIARASDNVAVRLPEQVIGIDIDAYGNKPGLATLTQLEEANGALPPTVIITNRDDGSGIRLFRLPDSASSTGMRTGWPGIEIIRAGHRYAVIAPSIHPDGRLYRVLGFDGKPANSLPTIDELPPLPAAWLEACKPIRGEAPPAAIPRPLRVVGDTDPYTPCKAMRARLEQAMSRLSGGEARHDVATAEAFALVRLAEQGHAGGAAALATLGGSFRLAIGHDRSGGSREADREWASIVATAESKAAADPTPEADKGCCGAAATTRSTTRFEDLLAVPSIRRIEEHEQDDEEPPTSSWRPVDLAPHLDGSYEPEHATLLRRGDSQGLFYPGRVHSLYGESESGKSWITMIAAAQLLDDSGRVLVVDFESDPGTVTGRLIALGVPRETLAACLTYIRPDERPSVVDQAYISLFSEAFDLAVIDGVTEALVMFGGASKDNDAITAWLRYFPRALARRTGAAVVLVDHVAKDKDTRGRFAIGGQAKLAGLDGAAYLVEPKTAIAPGLRGEIEIRITKDRPGHVRSNSGEYRNSDRTQLAATVILDSSGSAGTTWQVNVPEHLDEGEKHAPFRPTWFMEAVSRWLENNSEASTKAVREAIGKRAVHVDQALQRLLEEGYVTRSEGPRRANMWTFVKAFREVDDQLLRLAGTTSSRSSRPRPTSSPDEVARSDDIVPTTNAFPVGEGLSGTRSTAGPGTTQNPLDLVPGPGKRFCRSCGSSTPSGPCVSCGEFR
jgi:hypothetical protein